MDSAHQNNWLPDTGRLLSIAETRYMAAQTAMAHLTNGILKSTLEGRASFPRVPIKKKGCFIAVFDEFKQYGYKIITYNDKGVEYIYISWSEQIEEPKTYDVELINTIQHAIKNKCYELVKV